MIPPDADTVVIPPAPGDVEELLAERAAVAAYNARRSLTLAGGFDLAAVREAALSAMAPDEHLPFPLVRRVAAQR